jgi:hypothetical protein
MVLLIGGKEEKVEKLFFSAILIIIRLKDALAVHRYDHQYIKQKDNPPPLGGGRNFSLVPGSSPVPAGSRSDLLYNVQIAKQFASLITVLRR